MEEWSRDASFMDLYRLAGHVQVLPFIALCGKSCAVREIAARKFAVACYKQGDVNFKNLWSLLREAFLSWMAEEAPGAGAALAFYSILSLSPLVILVVSIVGLAFGNSAAQDQIIGQVEGLVGKQGGETIRAMIEHAQKPAGGSVASFIGLITLLFGASGVFGELQAALNKMWDVEAKSIGGIWATIRKRLLSFGLVLSVGFLMLVSLVMSAALAAVGKFYGGLLPLPEFILSGIHFVVSLAGTAFLFGLIFKYVPDAEVSWRDVWFGAITTAVLFTLGKYLIGLYIGKAAVGSAYGAAGSFVVVIVWIYYSSMIFLFGAEFTSQTAYRRMLARI